MNPLLIKNSFDGECADCSNTIRKYTGVMPSFIKDKTPVSDLPIWCSTTCYNKWVHKRSLCVDTLPIDELP